MRQWRKCATTCLSVLTLMVVFAFEYGLKTSLKYWGHIWGQIWSTLIHMEFSRLKLLLLTKPNIQLCLSEFMDSRHNPNPEWLGGRSEVIFLGGGGRSKGPYGHRPAHRSRASLFYNMIYDVNQRRKTSFGPSGGSASPPPNTPLS